MAKKLWSQLSDSTKQRYKRWGVSPNTYNAGKISPEFRKTIMGKGGESWTTQRAKQAGLADIVPTFDSMKKAEKERVADLWLDAMTKKIKPVHFNPDGSFELQETDKKFTHGMDMRDYVMGPHGKPIPNPNIGQPLPNKHYGHALIEPETVHSKMDIEEWLQKIGHGDMTKDDWKAFKNAYTASFTRGTRIK